MKRLVVVIVAVVILLGAGLGFFFFKNSAQQSGQPAVKRYPKPVIEAMAVEEKGDLVKAKAMYQKAMEKIKDQAMLEDIEKRIGDINIKRLLSPDPDEYSTKYTVQPKDTLTKIARQFNTTANLIKKVNQLPTGILYPGKDLKIINAKFSIVVDTPQNVLFLKANGEVIKTYMVSTGKHNCTPKGTFKIVNKMEKPVWYKTGAVIPPDSPENILGTRWMGINVTGYGIHGTTMPEQLGQAVSAGCIRMKNEDVEEVYDIVPVGTEVVIVGQ